VRGSQVGRSGHRIGRTPENCQQKFDRYIPDVFLIQNTQNRDTREIHLKLDELIEADKNARNEFIERLSDIELAELEQFLRPPGRSDQLYGNRRAAERKAVVRHSPAAL